MDEDTSIITVEPKIRLGVLEMETPVEMVERASKVATALSRVVNEQKLYTIIQGKKFVQVEGWETLGAMLGIVAREVPHSVTEHENGDFEASVELIRVSDGAVIGYGSALCGCDEVDRNGKQTWGNRARYARRSMAVTRAAGKAFRLSLSWIVRLAGYEPTPAEEMQDDQGSKWTVEPTETGGNGSKAATELIKPIPESQNPKVCEWPTNLLNKVVMHYKGGDIHEYRARLTKSTVLSPDDKLAVITHWMDIYNTERTAGIEPNEAAARADADRQATKESA